jgi:bacteriocin resistance YdeI/OmpD-like protein/uncharacterized protein DUF1905
VRTLRPVGKPLRIEVALEPRGPAAAIVLTDAQVELLGPGTKTFPVKVTINRTTVPLRLARMGGENLIGFSKAKRAEAGVDIGGTYRVVIEADTGDRQVDVPEDLATALQAGRLTKQFDALAYSHRKEYVRRIDEAKKPETRARRIADTIEKVRAGTTR